MWCVYFVRTCKAKQRRRAHNAGQKGFGFVESDDIIEVTPTRQNCDQTQLKVLNIKSNISVNMDVFNRTFVTQFPNVVLYYDVDWSRYCRTRKFYCELSFLETYLHSVENTLKVITSEVTNEGDHVGVTNEGDCCRVVWNDNYSTPTITIFIGRDLVYSELRS